MGIDEAVYGFLTVTAVAACGVLGVFAILALALPNRHTLVNKSTHRSFKPR
jgi:hypothetical protein